MNITKYAELTKISHNQFCCAAYGTDFFETLEKVAFAEELGTDVMIHSFIKKLKSKKGDEFYAFILYGNTKPISQYLGRKKRGEKSSVEKMGFNYFETINPLKNRFPKWI